MMKFTKWKTYMERGFQTVYWEDSKACLANDFKSHGSSLISHGHVFSKISPISNFVRSVLPKFYIVKFFYSKNCLKLYKNYINSVYKEDFIQNFPKQVQNQILNIMKPISKYKYHYKSRLKCILKHIFHINPTCH